MDDSEKTGRKARCASSTKRPGILAGKQTSDTDTEPARWIAPSGLLETQTSSDTFTTGRRAPFKRAKDPPIGISNAENTGDSLDGRVNLIAPMRHGPRDPFRANAQENPRVGSILGLSLVLPIRRWQALYSYRSGTGSRSESGPDSPVAPARYSIVAFALAPSSRCPSRL